MAGARRPIGVALVCVVLLGRAAPAPAQEIIERVLAVVAGDVITLADVTAAREFGLVPVDPAPDPVRGVLSRLIDRSLVLAEVDRYAPPEPDATAIDREVQALRDRYGSAQAFDTAAARTGASQASLREAVRQNLRIRAYFGQRFAVPPPGEDDVTAYLGSHPQAFTENGRTLSMDEARDQAARAMVEERRQRLIDSWVEGLRRHGDVTDLYLPSK
jgi:hypothetical protein